MTRAHPEPITIAVLAKAPLPGLVKTRLIPVLGAHAAAILQERLTERAVATAFAAAIGPVTLWTAPDETHPSFHDLAERSALRFRRQPDGDRGDRMLAALAAAGGPALVIGTDCPALAVEHLRAAAEHLRHGADIVTIPAEDGGYVLIGAWRPLPGLFSDMPWGTAAVMAETRQRLAAGGLTGRELAPLWDVDRPDDLDRMREMGFGELID